MDALLAMYDKETLTTSDQLARASLSALEQGAIDYLDYLDHLEEGITVRIKRLELLHLYNQAAINLNYLIY